MRRMPEDLKIGDFFERVGEGFRVPFAGGAIDGKEKGHAAKGTSANRTKEKP